MSIEYRNMKRRIRIRKNKLRARQLTTAIVDAGKMDRKVFRLRFLFRAKTKYRNALARACEWRAEMLQSKLEQSH